AFKQLFGRQTRSGTVFSPFMAEVDANLDRLILDAFVAADNTADVSPDSTPLNSPALSLLSSISEDSTSEDIEELTLPPPSNSQLLRPSSTRPYVLVPPAPYSISSTPKPNLRKPKSDAQRAKDKVRSRIRRNLKRKASKTTPPTVKNTSEDTSKTQKRIFLSALPTSVLVDADAISHSGYVGKAVPLPEKRAYSLQELKDTGFKVIEHRAGITQPILEKRSGSVFGWIAAGPKDSPPLPQPEDRSSNVHPEAKRSGPTTTWDANCDIMTQTIHELWPHCAFRKPALTRTQIDQHQKGTGGPNVLEPCRGVTETITCGISIGNGQQRPQQLRQEPANKKVWNVILNHHAFKRWSGFISGLFITWAPLLFLYYANTITSLLGSDSSLSRPFANSVFSAFTVNFGSNTVTYPHRDLKNLAFGLCAITALGNYDWRKGGHLILFDLKIVIEFPPGTTIFIPSSVLCHANTAIQPGEERYSVVQFSAGGLFRWVEQGFQAASVYWKTRSAAEKAWNKVERWRSGLAMFSTVEQLREDPGSPTDEIPQYQRDREDRMALIRRALERQLLQARLAQDDAELDPNNPDTVMESIWAAAAVRDSLRVLSATPSSELERSASTSSPEQREDTTHAVNNNGQSEVTNHNPDNVSTSIPSFLSYSHRYHFSYNVTCRFARHTDGEAVEREWAKPQSTKD
ncbi:hypothetical protein V5O48_015885, partial [Marasmius crinis-equi]